MHCGGHVQGILEEKNVNQTLIVRRGQKPHPNLMLGFGLDKNPEEYGCNGENIWLRN